MSIKCPICGDIKKRINNMHLKKHGLTVKQFINQYPDFARTESLQKKEKMIIGIDCVLCPICDGKFKELNNFHFKKHSLTVKEFKQKYPHIKTISKRSSENKNVYKNISKEMSDKLKKSHTLENYIEKYGADKGLAQFKLIKKRRSYCRTLLGYIERYGYELGNKKYKEDNKKKSLDLISFQRRYGEKEGLKKYLTHCENLSKKRRHFEGSQRLNYEKYRRKVRKISNISIQKFKLLNSEKRSRRYHLDHKYPIISGYLEKVHPVIIGSIYNLEILSSHLNCTKKMEKTILLETLKNKVLTNNFYIDMMDSINFDFFILS